MLNCNIPLIYAKVDWGHLTHGKEAGFKDCVIFGVASIPGYALLFHCQLSNGAVYYRLPIDKFSWKDIYPKEWLFLEDLQRWNCPSAEVNQITYTWLFNQSVTYAPPSTFDISVDGTYITTLDWFGNGTTAENAQEHKCAHLIKLANGQFALSPNNFLLWHEPSNVKIDGSHRSLRTNHDYPSVEG